MWWGVDSNHRHPPLQDGALPLSYPTVYVAEAGFEPATYGLSSEVTVHGATFRGIYLEQKFYVALTN